MTAPQAQQPSEWVEKAMSLAGALADAGIAGWSTPEHVVARRTAESEAVLFAHLTQREAAFAAVVEALERICSHTTRSSAQIDADWDSARAALALARAGEGKV